MNCPDCGLKLSDYALTCPRCEGPEAAGRPPTSAHPPSPPPAPDHPPLHGNSRDQLRALDYQLGKDERRQDRHLADARKSLDEAGSFMPWRGGLIGLVAGMLLVDAYAVGTQWSGGSRFGPGSLALLALLPLFLFWWGQAKKELERRQGTLHLMEQKSLEVAQRRQDLEAARQALREREREQPRQDWQRQWEEHQRGVAEAAQREADERQRADEEQRKAEDWQFAQAVAARMRGGEGLPTVPSPILLRAGEQCHHVAATMLYLDGAEAGFFFNNDGSLILTSQRLVFLGSQVNAETFALTDVLTVDLWEEKGLLIRTVGLEFRQAYVLTYPLEFVTLLWLVFLAAGLTPPVNPDLANRMAAGRVFGD